VTPEKGFLNKKQLSIVAAVSSITVSRANIGQILTNFFTVFNNNADIRIVVCLHYYGSVARFTWLFAKCV